MALLFLVTFSTLSLSESAVIMEQSEAKEWSLWKEVLPAMLRYVAAK